ncbi:MAG: DUF488 domain-containing protein [Nitrospira sp.]|nr:DUF488 domain-containing protein [Nitrospira sp.]
MGKILVKRVYEPVTKSDGVRVLVDRLWPRGLSKSDAKLDLWLPDLGPSTALRKWFNHDPTRWVEFLRRYHAELKEKIPFIATIKKQAKTRAVTLLYSAKDTQYNQAVALRSFLLRRTYSRASEVQKKISAAMGTGRKKMQAGLS